MRDHPAVPWNTLEPKVEEFAKAGSKSQKLAWFRSQKDIPLSSYTSHPDFLQHINLPDFSGGRASRLNAPMLNVRESQVSSGDRLPPEDAYRFVERFLDLWIVQHSPQRALELANPEEVAKPFAREPGPGTSADTARSLLAMWLVRDHGMVNLLGHGVE